MRLQISPFVIFYVSLTVGACATPTKEKPQQAAEAKAVTEVASAPGTADVVAGDVQIRSGETGKITPLQQGQKIQAKDTVITGKGAKVKLVMEDKNELHMADDTKMEIQTYDKKKVLLNLIRGKIRAQVREKYDGTSSTFRIKTPATVSGVRGTDFLAAFKDDQALAEIVTFDGAVEFGQAGPDGSIRNPVTVEAGQISKAVQDLPPTKPKVLTKAELDKLKDEVTVSDEKVQEAVRWLRNGNQRFVRHQLRKDGQSKKDVQRLAKAQRPHAIVMACSDSRIPPEIIFDQKLGEIFVIRSSGIDQSGIAAAENAAKQFGVNLLVILGHTKAEQNDPWENPQALAAALQERSPLLSKLNVQTAIYDLSTGVVTFE